MAIQSFLALLRLQKINRFIVENVQKVYITLKYRGSVERSGPNGPLVSRNVSAGWILQSSDFPLVILENA